MAERLGVLGGTFDPIHCGHVLLARFVLERLPLDRVLFVVAADPPHKSGVSAPAEHRWRMVRLAIQGLREFEACALELERRGPSYTVDTLRRLRDDHPDTELFLIVGADNVPDLVTWHDPRGILELATVVAGSRVEASGSGGLGDRIQRLDTPAFEISSTEVRQRRRQGLSCRYLVPEAVERYMAEHRLYES